MSATSNSTNPFVGPEPFTLGNREFFFGRDSEASQLLSLIVAHPVFLLYAQSGAGKTSLVNAELIPRLEAKGFEVLGPARVQGLSVPPDFGDDDNIFVLNVSRYLKPDDNNTPEDKSTDLRKWLKRGLTPDDEEPSPRVLIFDQFEELFTFYGERWQDRKKFFEQIADVVYEDPLLRVLFVMREDHIAELAQFEQLMPGKLQMRLRLERLRKSSATAAIREPLKKVNRNDEFADEVAKQVTAELLKIHVQSSPGVSVQREGEFVEAVQLQVVCHRMWESRWASVPPDQKEVTDKQRVSLDDIDWALTVFYEEGIRKVAQKTSVGENELRRWFQDKLITPAKTRGMVFGGEHDAAGLPIAAVKALEDLHLIRGDNRAGARWYELTHDRFIDPILESNRQSLGVFETVRHALSRTANARLIAAVWFIVLIAIWLVFLESLPSLTQKKVAQLAWVRENLSAVRDNLDKEETFINTFKDIQQSYEDKREVIAKSGNLDEKRTRDEWKSKIQQFDSQWDKEEERNKLTRKHDERLLRKQSANLIGNLVAQKTKSDRPQERTLQLNDLLSTRKNKELDAQSKSQSIWLKQRKEALEDEEESLTPLGIPLAYVLATLPTIWCLSLFALVIYVANARGKLMIYKRILRTFQGNQSHRPASAEKIILIDPIGWDVTRKVAPAVTMIALIVVMLVQFRVSLLGIEVTKLIGSNWATMTIAGFTVLALICSILGICIWIARSARQGSATTDTQVQQA